jgi:hypothetical protein
MIVFLYLGFLLVTIPIVYAQTTYDWFRVLINFFFPQVSQSNEILGSFFGQVVLSSIVASGPTSVQKGTSSSGPFYNYYATFKNSDGSAYANQQILFLWIDPPGNSNQLTLTTDNNGVADLNKNGYDFYFADAGTYQIWF